MKPQQKQTKAKGPRVNSKKLNSILRQKGEGYTIGKSCNLVPPKTVQECPKCISHGTHTKFQCTSFSETVRQKIFTEFYKLANRHLQHEFINRHVYMSEKKESRGNVDSRRQMTYSYHLTTGGQKKVVCKQFLLATLAISEKMLRVALSKLTDVGTVEPDRRGGRKLKNSERDAIIKELVDQHLDRFPRVESEFCPENSLKEYLSSDLTVKKMFDMFILEHKYQEHHEYLPSLHYYQKRFRDKNLAFYSPKKQQ